MAGCAIMPESRNSNLFWCTIGVALLLALTAWGVKILNSDRPQPVTPTAWGSDHAGQDIPEYVTGEQCLFCHREKIGPSWAKNRHSLTIRVTDSTSPPMKALGTSPAKSLS